MTTATWLDAEIELAKARLQAATEAAAALTNLDPWLTPLERNAADVTHVMLAERIKTEQANLDRHEAALRHEGS